MSSEIEIGIVVVVIVITSTFLAGVVALWIGDKLSK